MGKLIYKLNYRMDESLTSQQLEKIAQNLADYRKWLRETIISIIPQYAHAVPVISQAPTER